MNLLAFSCPGFLGEPHFVGRGQRLKNATGFEHTKFFYFKKDDLELQFKSSSILEDKTILRGVVKLFQLKVALVLLLD